MHAYDMLSTLILDHHEHGYDLYSTNQQNIFADQKYNKPFFVTYVNTASFSFYLLGPLFRKWKQKCIGKKTMSGTEHTAKSIPSTSSYGSVSPIGSLDNIRSTESTLEQGAGVINPNDIPLSHREVAHLSFAFCILWFAANWATNASLAYTTVASSTILASMSGFFTLAIGAALRTETFSTLKLIAVCGSVIGVALVSESDRGSPNMEPTAPRAPLFGDFLALISALFYGCYTVLLKLRIQNESRVNMSLFFGFVGLFNLLLLWPVFGVLHWTGVEPFELPHDTRIIWMIAINAFIGTFVSDYLWLLSMLMTSPLVVTLGLSLTIPLALLGDVVGYGRVLGLGYWIGAGLVLAGFFGVNGAALTERDEAEQKENIATQSIASSATVTDATTTLAVDERGETQEREPLLAMYPREAPSRS
ncbi:hypothetical protein BC939DRAFT_505208 [Gamsiella multidivaricata]|uniref:uncharacterized protein n=1 Tax=Gamsiella multidivaricata TaxID=101098 RepID=UPI0022208387|nr:uncharacterized protein BC939DRAFT_505208 [Gamsiella multidivaricata]KAG0357657.1 hypothetical protein BGZ54_000258 [Gamsiella multidivaricata]KAI7820153.1 hypothetical protein BC939DRAFT_505208 [Gamsiella multidivaricata]